MKRIYIDDLIHEQLKKEAKQQGRTLQKVVEDKLTLPPFMTAQSPNYWERGTPVSEQTEESPKVLFDGYAEGKSPEVSYNVPPAELYALGAEMPCCIKKSPCKHWAWDGEDWVNSLSGRKRETEI